MKLKIKTIEMRNGNNKNKLILVKHILLSTYF